METFFKEFYELLSGLHSDLEAAVGGLSTADLDWQPGVGMNSLAVLLTHTAASERYWIGEVAGEDPANRRRAQEFETRGREAEELQLLLQHTLAHTHNVLAKLTLEDLEQARSAPLQGRTVTVAYALLHSLEHTAGHLGHAQVARDLLDRM